MTKIHPLLDLSGLPGRLDSLRPRRRSRKCLAGCTDMFGTCKPAVLVGSCAFGGLSASLNQALGSVTSM